MSHTPQFVYISAQRYALGRQTYIVSETVDWLLNEYGNDFIEPKTLGVMRRDISEALSGGSTYAAGAEMDRKQWQKFMEHTEHE